MKWTRNNYTALTSHPFRGRRFEHPANWKLHPTTLVCTVHKLKFVSFCAKATLANILHGYMALAAKNRICTFACNVADLPYLYILLVSRIIPREVNHCCKWSLKVLFLHTYRCFQGNFERLTCFHWENMLRVVNFKHNM